MRTTTMPAMLFLLLAIATCVPPILVRAADAPAPVNTLTAEEKQQGWKLLFDGKTLDGWMAWKTKKSVGPGAWVVEDGAMTLAKSSRGADIYTADPYENFELSLEWKTTGNSGIFLRVDPSSSGAIYAVAPEVQIERTGGNANTSAGGLYALYEIEGEKILNPDGWNEVRIRIVDGHATHWLNGKKTYEYTIGDKDWNARLAKSKFKNAKGFGLNANGHIGFQDHGHAVSFRNVKIRDLKANP